MDLPLNTDFACFDIMISEGFSNYRLYTVNCTAVFADKKANDVYVFCIHMYKT